MQAISYRDTARLRNDNCPEYGMKKGVAPAVRAEVSPPALEAEGHSTHTHSR